MAYRIGRREAPRAALCRIMTEQIDRGLAELDDPEIAPGTAIHQVRKRCKKLRGVLRLFRGALPARTFKTENRRYRDAARLIGGARDADVAMGTLDALGARPDLCEAERESLRAARAALEETAALEAPVRAVAGDSAAALRAALAEGRAAAGALTLGADGHAAIAGGQSRTYRDGRARMAAAEGSGTAADLHEWRKRVKDHWYHMRLLEGMWPGPQHALAQELRDLSERLGEDHDLWLLGERIRGHGGDMDAALALIARRRDALQAAAFAQGARVHAEKPKAQARRMAALWAAWRPEDA